MNRSRRRTPEVDCVSVGVADRRPLGNDDIGKHRNSQLPVVIDNPYGAASRELPVVIDNPYGAASRDADSGSESIVTSPDSAIKWETRRLAMIDQKITEYQRKLYLLEQRKKIAERNSLKRAVTRQTSRFICIHASCKRRFLTSLALKKHYLNKHNLSDRKYNSRLTGRRPSTGNKIGNRISPKSPPSVVVDVDNVENEAESNARAIVIDDGENRGRERRGRAPSKARPGGVDDAPIVIDAERNSASANLVSDVASLDKYRCKRPSCVDKAFLTQQALLAHVVKSHAISTRPSRTSKFRCKFQACSNKLFLTKESLANHYDRRHKLTAEPKTKPVITCSFVSCTAKFITKRGLIVHMNRAHAPKPKSPRQQADGTIATVVRAVSTPNGTNGKTRNLKCSFVSCLAQFKTTMGLIQHVKNSHSQNYGEKTGTNANVDAATAAILNKGRTPNLKCSFVSCTSRFFNMMGLVQHMKRCHSQSSVEAAGESAHYGTGGDYASSIGSSPEAEKMPKTSPQLLAHTPFQLEKLSKKTKKKGESLLHQLASKQQNRDSRRGDGDESYVPACGDPSLPTDEVSVKIENVRLFKWPISSSERPYRQIADGLDVQVQDERRPLGKSKSSERRSSVEYPDTNLVNIRGRVPNVFYACRKTNHFYYASKEIIPETSSRGASATGDCVPTKREVDETALETERDDDVTDDDSDCDDGLDTRSDSTIDDDEISDSRTNQLRFDYSKLLRPCFIPIFRDELAVRGKRK